MTGPEFTESVSNEIRQSIAIARELADGLVVIVCALIALWLAL